MDEDGFNISDDFFKIEEDIAANNGEMSDNIQKGLDNY